MGFYTSWEQVWTAFVMDSFPGYLHSKLPWKIEIVLLLQQKTDLFMSRIIKQCFPLGQRFCRFTYSPLYIGVFLSLGFLSCDTKPLCTTSGSTVCHSHRNWGTKEMTQSWSSRRMPCCEESSPLVSDPRVSCLQPALMCLWHTNLLAYRYDKILVSS